MHLGPREDPGLRDLAERKEAGDLLQTSELRRVRGRWLRGIANSLATWRPRGLAGALVSFRSSLHASARFQLR